MKKLLITLLAFIPFMPSSFAQNKIEKYCEIDAIVGARDKAKISFISGKVDSLSFHLNTLPQKKI